MWVPARLFLVLIPENLPDPGLPLSEAELDPRGLIFFPNTNLAAGLPGLRVAPDTLALVFSDPTQPEDILLNTAH